MMVDVGMLQCNRYSIDGDVGWCCLFFLVFLSIAMDLLFVGVILVGW
jgi:hypothetical protein